jgi:hypothetical protein
MHHATEAATRIDVAHDQLLTAAIMLPNDLPTQVGTRDLMNRVLDDLKRLRDQVIEAVDAEVDPA